MNFNNICLGALALFMVSGVALAGALDEPDNMAPISTHSGMKTMKPMEKFKTAFMAMPKEKQDAMMKECQDAAKSKARAECTGTMNTLGGANK